MPKNATESAPEIALVQGDLTTQDVDAIVNAANSTLLGGGGVDGAIHQAGGPSILAECDVCYVAYWFDEAHGYPLRDRGICVPTLADALARGAIGGAALDVSCHAEALRVADELGARTVAFPAISTGAFGYPLEEAAAVAVRAVRGADTRVEEVRFVLFGREAFDAFERALGR